MNRNYKLPAIIVTFLSAMWLSCTSSAIHTRPSLGLDLNWDYSQESYGSISVSPGMMKEIDTNNNKTLNLQDLLEINKVFNEIKSSKQARATHQRSVQNLFKFDIRALIISSETDKGTLELTKKFKKALTDTVNKTEVLTDTEKDDANEIVDTKTDELKKTLEKSNTKDSIDKIETEVKKTLEEIKRELTTKLNPSTPTDEGLSNPYYQLITSAANTVLGGQVLQNIYNISKIPADMKLYSVPIVVSFQPGRITRDNYLGKALLEFTMINDKLINSESFHVVAVAPAGFTSTISETYSNLMQNSLQIGLSAQIKALTLSGKLERIMEQLDTLATLVMKPDFHVNIRNYRTLEFWYLGQQFIKDKVKLSHRSFVVEAIVLCNKDLVVPAQQEKKEVVSKYYEKILSDLYKNSFLNEGNPDSERGNPKWDDIFNKLRDSKNDYGYDLNTVKIISYLLKTDKRYNPDIYYSSINTGNIQGNKEIINVLFTRIIELLGVKKTYEKDLNENKKKNQCFNEALLGLIPLFGDFAIKNINQLLNKIDSQQYRENPARNEILVKTIVSLGTDVIPELKKNNGSQYSRDIIEECMKKFWRVYIAYVSKGIYMPINPVVPISKAPESEWCDLDAVSSLPEINCSCNPNISGGVLYVYNLEASKKQPEITKLIFYNGKKCVYIFGNGLSGFETVKDKIFICSEDKCSEWVVTGLSNDEFIQASTSVSKPNINEKDFNITIVKNNERIYKEFKSSKDNKNDSILNIADVAGSFDNEGIYIKIKFQKTSKVGISGFSINNKYITLGELVKGVGAIKYDGKEEVSGEAMVNISTPTDKHIQKRTVVIRMDGVDGTNKLYDNKTITLGR